MGEINIHDRFFKKYLENPRIAGSFLSYILPEGIKKIADLSSLTSTKTGFIDEELKEAYSDLLFKTRLKSGEDLYIYFLIEHKSYYYEHTALQLLKYMVRLWEREIKEEEKKRLTPIIPVVFYHGEEKWKAGNNFRSLIEGIEENPEIVEYLPDFRYAFFGLREETDIEDVSDIILKTFLQVLLLKKGLDEGRIKVEVEKIFWQMREMDRGYSYLQVSIIEYILGAVEKIDEAILIECIEKILPERREDLMTLAEKWRREGIKEGREQGIQEGIEKGIEKAALNALQKGLDLQIIAEITGLSVERIEELKKKLN